jgi:hypothetical protein
MDSCPRFRWGKLPPEETGAGIIILLDKFLEIKYLLTKLNIFNFPFDERDRRKTESLPIGESNDP